MKNKSKKPKPRVKNSLFNEFLIRMWRNKLAVAGFFVLMFIFLIAIFAPFIAPYNYAEQNYDAILLFPNAQHWFGTDNFGRDVLSRIIYGSRYTMFIGFTVVTVNTVFGTALAYIAAYYRKADNLIMRISEVFGSVPGMCFYLAFISTLGSSIQNMMIAMCVSGIFGANRIQRAQVLMIKEQEYIEAARCIGAGSLRIMLKHIFPNSVAVLIVQYTLGLVNVILMSASLSFIGLGAQPPTPEWGLMISAGRVYLREYWHMAIIPGLAIVVTTFALNLLGDGLRDALDPRLRQ